MPHLFKPSVVVFAHVPPPVHGQSLMIKLMLEGLKVRFPELALYHVDARFSRDMDDLGNARLGKLTLAFKYIWQAARLRWKEGVQTLYYVPAPVKRSALVRDCFQLSLLRIIFPKIIFHWHAVGLGEWISGEDSKKSKIDRLLRRYLLWVYKGHELSIVLTEWGKSGVSALQPKAVSTVYNGLADPCPDFDSTILPVRQARAEELQSVEGLNEIRVGFLGHCTEDKGLFEFLDALALANQKGQKFNRRFTGIVAGEFQDDETRIRFENVAQSDKLKRNGVSTIDFRGFVSGDDKEAFWRDCDLLAFPTRYVAESFGLVIVEAMAHGVTPVASDWRMLPEIMGKCGLPVSPVGDATALANAFMSAVGRDRPENLRRMSIEYFSEEAHLLQLGQALLSVNTVV